VILEKPINDLALKVLLGLIFPSGLSWNYDGTLNHTINPIYQLIFLFLNKGIRSGVGDRSQFEPLLFNTLSHFNKLMEVYQPENKENKTLTFV
jgi:hypothetical protein